MLFKFKIDRARIRKFELKILPQWKIVVLLLTVLVPLNLQWMIRAAEHVVT